VIGVKVGEEYPVHILPGHPDLPEALHCAATCVEKKFLSPRFHQGAWPEPIQDRRWCTGTQEGYLDVWLKRDRFRFELSNKYVGELLSSIWYANKSF
jgi:hypothetical protein